MNRQVLLDRDAQAALCQRRRVRDMLHDVIAASYKGGYRIELNFDNGERGVVDFAEFADKGGVFERLRDMAFFQGFSVNEELGTLTWSGEIDIAPETLYAKATGRGLPEWMESE